MSTQLEQNDTEWSFVVKILCLSEMYLHAVIIIGFHEQIDIEIMLAICNGSPSILNCKC